MGQREFLIVSLYLQDSNRTEPIMFHNFLRMLYVMPSGPGADSLQVFSMFIDEVKVCIAS